jgi:hypothetical protein
MFDEDEKINQISAKGLNGSKSAYLQIKRNQLSNDPFHDNAPPVNSSPSYLRSKNHISTQVKSSKSINLDSKKRLEQKYEEALEKLT